MIEISEILYRWTKQMPKKRIAKSLGMSINTIRKVIRKVIRKAESLGMQQTEKDLNKISAISEKIKVKFVNKKNTTAQSAIAIYHDQIRLWHSQRDMTITQMQRLLKEQNFSVSYSSLMRYVSKHFPKTYTSTVVLHTPPGKEAQVDFGYVGHMFDPVMQRLRKAYAFVMTLSYSRYRFVRFVFKQDSPTWIDCHIRAFEFFGGVPETVILDNLKSGVIKPHIYDPTINKAYAELERYYGFVIDPTKIATPTHKGKVERSIPIVRQQLIAGREYSSIVEANEKSLSWCRYEIAHRVTRTTGETPWARFTRDEKSKLLDLPVKPYECPIWQSGIVHKDHHVVVAGSFYSVPTNYIGRTVWIRVGNEDVQIFFNDTCIKIHAKSKTTGSWVTDSRDYPEKARAFIELDKKTCQKKAKALGEKVYAFIEPLLSPFSRTQQRKALAIFRLADQYGGSRLNKACGRALLFENNEIGCLTRILEKSLEAQSVQSDHQKIDLDGAFLRNPSEFIVYH